MTPDVWNKVRDLRPEEFPAVLAELDSCGLFPAPEETLEQFRSRLAAMFQELEAIRNGSSELQELIGQAPPVSGELRREADQLTWAKYRFRAGWIPAWYSTRQTGFFSVGILLEVDRRLPLLFLHGGFRRRKVRRGYGAAETMAHELVHAVRCAFPTSGLRGVLPLPDERFPVPPDGRESVSPMVSAGSAVRRHCGGSGAGGGGAAGMRCSAAAAAGGRVAGADSGQAASPGGASASPGWSGAAAGSSAAFRPGDCRAGGDAGERDSRRLAKHLPLADVPGEILRRVTPRRAVTWRPVRQAPPPRSGGGERRNTPSSARAAGRVSPSPLRAEVRPAAPSGRRGSVSACRGSCFFGRNRFPVSASKSTSARL